MNIQNYGFTKTLVQHNGRYSDNEMQWRGNYDGNMANIDVDIYDNGFDKHVSMQLDNNDLAQLLGIQPVDIPLERRLKNDFLKKSRSRKSRRLRRKGKSRKRYKPLLIEGALYPKYIL